MDYMECPLHQQLESCETVRPVNLDDMPDVGVETPDELPLDQSEHRDDTKLHHQMARPGLLRRSQKLDRYAASEQMLIHQQTLEP